MPRLRYYTDLIHIIEDEIPLYRAENCYRAYMQERYYAPSNPFHFFKNKRHALWAVVGQLYEEGYISHSLLRKIRYYFFLTYLIDIISFIIRTSSFRLNDVVDVPAKPSHDIVEFVNDNVVIKTASEYMGITSQQIITRDQKTALSLRLKFNILLLALRYRTITFRAIAQYLLVRRFWDHFTTDHLICIEANAPQDYFHVWNARRKGCATTVVVPFIYALPLAYHVTSVALPYDCIEDEFSALNTNITVLDHDIEISESGPDFTKKIALVFGSNTLVSDAQIMRNITDIGESISRPSAEWYLSLHPQIRFNKPRLAAFAATLPKAVQIRENEPNDAFLNAIDLMITERSTFIEEALKAGKTMIVLTSSGITPAENKLHAQFPSKLWYCETIEDAIKVLRKLDGSVR